MTASGGDRIPVLMVDDHPVVLAGLRTALAMDAGLNVVGEASGGEEAIALVEQLRPAVVLMDLVMPGLSGIQATMQLQERHRDVAVILLTGHFTDDILVAAIRAGARGVLRKESQRALIPAAVRVAAQGGTVVPWDALARILARGPASAPTPLPPLDERELGMLRAVARGNTNRVIAAEMHLAVPTVKKRMQALMAKLGVADRTQASALAIRFGLID